MLVSNLYNLLKDEEMNSPSDTKESKRQARSYLPFLSHFRPLFFTPHATKAVIIMPTTVAAHNPQKYFGVSQ